MTPARALASLLSALVLASAAACAPPDARERSRVASSARGATAAPATAASPTAPTATEVAVAPTPPPRAEPAAPAPRSRTALASPLPARAGLEPGTQGFELARTIEGDRDPAQRRQAIDAYTASEDEADPLVRAVLADPDPIVRRWAALALEREARPDLVAPLRQAVASEPDPKVRHILERALQRANRS